MKKTNLGERAMLAQLTISQWTARRHDRKVTEETNQSHGAAADAGRYNKLLLAKEHTAAIQSVVSKARAGFYERTLPWFDNGQRVLTTEGFQGFSDFIRDLREEWEAAVAAFVTGYPAAVEQAQARLNGMFNADDYPSPDEIAGKFAFGVDFLPIPDASDFRAAVGDAQAEIIKSRIEQSTREAIDAAMKDVHRRIAEIVGNMANRLAEFRPGAEKGERHPFRDSIVSNVRELAELLPTLNVVDDPAIAELAGKIASTLCQSEPQELREDATLRASVQAEAQSILDQVSAFLA